MCLRDINTTILNPTRKEIPEKENNEECAVDWIPGWQTAAAANWWSNAWFFASIVCLIFLGVCEVISHRYSERKDELNAARESAAQQQHDIDIATLQAQAAKASETAAKAQLELEKYKAPRALSAEQIATLAARLKPFGKISFDVALEQSHETASLLAQICSALESAGWDWQDWKRPGVVYKLPKQGRIAGSASVDGVEIQVAESDRLRLNKPATELINSLIEFGIATKPRVYFDEDAEKLGYTPGLLHVVIGSKGAE
jgi:hypothetical protein